MNRLDNYPPFLLRFQAIKLQNPIEKRIQFSD